MIPISTFVKHASQDELVAAFEDQLATLEPVPEELQVPVVAASDLAQLVIKCADQLEEAGLDAAAADEVLAEIESVV